MALLLGGVVNQAWGYKVTYHVLTLPMDHEKNNTLASEDGRREEAIRTIVDDGLFVELPSNFKSPLAKNFRYYASSNITTYSAAKLYANNNTKHIRYTITDEADSLSEGSAITANCDIYVTYEYDADNSIAKLDGSRTYNLTLGDGFLAYNRGRNNRPAVIPKEYVSAEQLTSEDFVYVNVSKVKSSTISTYWSSENNKNPREKVESQFYFRFKYLGEDPYNITICTGFDDDYNEWFIEKADKYDVNFVRKYFKGSILFGQTTSTLFISSEWDKKYTTVYDSPAAVADETLVGTTSLPGTYRNFSPIWNSVTMLDAGDGGGYVYMATRNAKSDGTLDFTTTKVDGKYQYYFLKSDHNNVQYALMTVENAASKYSTDEEMYEIENVHFKITTPFYALASTDGERAAHTVVDSIQLSQFTIESKAIDIEDIPASLKRKYCNFTGRFFKDAAHTLPITNYSQMTKGVNDIYVEYELANNMPFEAITPASTYSAATWTSAAWYELTDDGSVEANGKKLIYDGSSYFKNNGASGSYEKTSEFAFIGDPYELRVISRSLTSGSTPYYLGATGGTPATGTDLTASTSATTGYKWQIPYDNTAGSFLLQLYKGAGYWKWDANHLSADFAYATKAQAYSVTNSNPQTFTFTITGLTYVNGHYITVNKGGTDAAQVTSTTPTLSTGHGAVRSDGTATVTVNIAANGSGANKTFTLSIQEYNGSDNSTIGDPMVITITQDYTAYAGDAVEYNTSNSTRIKVLDLPARTYTYKVIDKAGNIAVKATATQTIYSGLSLASIPSIIVSPFLVGETLTFYNTFDNGGGAGSGTSRTHLSNSITETPNSNADIYVKYTTTHLDDKPIKLSEDQEFNVRLNGKFIYYDRESDQIKSANTVPDDEDAKKYYLWKLRQRDPYSMIIDNLGARTSDTPEYPDVYDDEGTKTNPERQPGAWLKLSDALGNDVGFTIDGNRANAQRFIAKSSLNQGVYEVMVATGDDVDASTTYYNIGRPADNTVKIYDNNTASGGYAHGNSVLAFKLEQTLVYTYYLIDKAKHKLLEIETKSADLVLPAEYQSPLVGTYRYYAEDNITVNGDEYTPTVPGTTIDNLEAVYTKTSGDYASQWSAADGTHKKTATNATNVDEQAKQLTSTGDFYFRIGETSDYYLVNVTKAFHNKIYVTYDKNSLVTFNDNSSPYMLKFLNPYATGYYLEDGNDKLYTTNRIQAVYPYTNGDGNLNIYGQAMNEEQMNGGSSTRPRWIWFFDSDHNDPYHVKIHSQSTISYNGISHPTYLETKAIAFKQDPSTKHVITGGSLPGIASTLPTEYMILGTEGNYKLVTTETIDDGVSNERRTVTSFEQYWKTYNMIKLFVLGMNKSTNAFSNDESTWVVPDSLRAALNTRLAALGVGSGEWHSYDAIANAVRWNGYNDLSSGHEKKLIEKLEHWFQTFDMGDGAFDIISADIPPVLVLLDRHGWEIMRKPLPPSATYPYGEELDVLKSYDSPLVEKYHFYSNATKATGCHKYTLRMQNGALRDEIKVNGTPYTSTSLGALPPATATGVKSGGAFQDMYVTYTVKEEYENSYRYNLELDEEHSTFTETGTASKFLLLTNGRFFRDNGDGAKLNYLSKPIRQGSDVPNDKGEVNDMILTPTSNYADTNGDGIVDDNNLWYVGPNLNIDKEMGIKWALAAGGSSEPMTEYETKKAYAEKTGFDPYNIQLQHVSDSKYLSTHAATTALSGGAMAGDYPDDNNKLTLETWVNVKDSSAILPKIVDGKTVNEGYDHTNLQLTNQTFMAVSDANGNMQLMPRFDHSLRITVDNNAPYLTTLEEPESHAKANVNNWRSMGPQTAFLVRPQIFEYHIIDNDGNESLRYKTSGEYTPSIPSHFKSPLATDFTYYAGLTMTDGVCEEIAAKADIEENEIAGTFAKAGLNDMTNQVYVRYSYNPSADHDELLQGKWFTITLDGKDVQAKGTLVPADNPATDGVDEQGTGVSLYSGTKPGTVDEDDKKWQWKFLAAPTDPNSDYYVPVDPYAVQIFNREKNYTRDLSLDPNPMGVSVKVHGCNRFALLSHSSGGYALAAAGNHTYPYTYYFLNGASMTTPEDGSPAAADTVAESTNNTDTYHFTIKSSALSAGTQLTVNDDVEHNYVYNVITKDTIINAVNEGNKLAIRSTQDNTEAELHSYAPYLPEDAQSPLLNMEDYLYYGSVSISGSTYSVVPATALITLYGLYDDTVYVRYNLYNIDNTEYKVPNQKDVVDGKVARHSDSKDASMNIDGGLPYNIIWEDDNIMKKGDADAISSEASHALSGEAAYVWLFEGNDPYALKIKHKNSGKYVNSTATLAEAGSAKNYMLLRKTGYEYGILQETGANNRLTGYGQSTTTGDPKYFIIFGLSTHKVIYHLVIDSTSVITSIPYRTGTEASPGVLTEKEITGTSQRDLKSAIFGVPGDRYQLGTTILGQTYCVDVGQVSVGDELQVPNEFKRANCNYFFYVDNIQTAGATATYQKTVASEDAMATDAASLAAVGDYYYKITGQYIYRKVHVVSVSPAAYEISGCTAADYTTSGSALTAADEAALITAADAIAAVGDYYYRVGPIDIYKRARVTAVSPVTYSVVDCTLDDWTNVWQDNVTLNGSYKGLEITRLMSDSRLIGSAVKINVAYSFQTGLKTNAGEGFVTSLSQNLWYTFETKDGLTPYLAHYTNAWGLQSMAGRDTRFTNDYLWSPLGDVYGFKMYNRYMIKNSNGAANVMTMPTMAEGTNLKMAVPDGSTIPYGYEVFELLGAYTDGYFLVHPVINNIGTQYYVKRHTADTDVSGDGRSDLNYAVLSADYSEWTFGLTSDLLKPYIDRIGYLGGLKETVYTANKALLDRITEGTADYADLRNVQGIVYNDANIVPYAPGYYRLHNQPSVSGISPVRYASGYLHDIEKTAGAGSTPIPMHFYSKAGVSTTFGSSGLNTGYTSSDATRGDVPVPATEYDPSTIFYISGNTTQDGNPRSTLQTQGLYVKGVQTDDDHGNAVMTATAGEATTFSLMDIGGAVFLIHDGSVPASRKYFNFSQSYTVSGDNKIYDLKYFHNSPTDDAKWCIQPVQNESAADINEKPLMVTTHNGGDDYYYTTFYAPFDVLLPDDIGTTTYYAYVCKKWYDEGINPVLVPASSPYPAGKYVPAGTPVIIRTSDNSGTVTLALPNNSPSEEISCIFTGQYLEQMLSADASHDVYTFGLPFTTAVTINRSTGDITAELPEQAKSGVGFYINANPNKESSAMESTWRRNNRYVLHNKIYYRASSGPALAPENSIQFVPVNFDEEQPDEERPGEEQPDDSKQTAAGDGCIYDMLGRKVATAAEVKNGVCWYRLQPGVYIIDGKKILIH